MELELGILLSGRRDSIQGARLRTWMDSHVLPEFSERTLPVDTAVALRCARLHVPDPRPDRDSYIEATALVHGMTVVTRTVIDQNGRAQGRNSVFKNVWIQVGAEPSKKKINK